MAITEALRILITADSAGAVKGIQQVGRTAERELSRAEKSLDRWGSRLTTVGTGLIAFGAVAAVGLNSAARSAGQLEQAVGGTEAIFKDASGVIDEFAKTSAESVGLSETAFRNLTTRTGGLLKNLGFSLEDAANESVKLTKIGADLAATFGGTTAEAVDALGASFRGEADPAERFGLRLNINTVNAKAVALGLADSTAAVDDHARAQATLALIMEQSADAEGQFARESDTLQGRQQRLAAQFENLKAEIGEGVLPAMETLFSVAKGGIGAFSGLNDATGGALGQFATIATVASLGVGGLSLLAGQAIRMRDAFGTARDAAVALRTRIQGLGASGTALASLPGVLVAVAAGFEMWNEQQQRMNISRMTEEFLAAGDSAEAMRDVMSTLVDQGPAELIGTFEQLASTNREAAERFIETAEAAGASGDFIAAMRDKLESVSAAEQQTTADTEGLAESMGGAAEGTEDATSALQEYSDTLKAMTDPVFAAMDAITGVRDAQVGLAEAERGVFEAQVALNEAIAAHGPGSAEAAEAARGLEDAERDLSDAQWATVESAAEADSALAGLKDAVENGDVSVATFKSTLAQWVAQGFLTQAQADQAARSVEGLADEADKADDKRVDIPVKTPGSETSRDRLRRVKEEAFAIPKSRSTSVSVSGVQFAIGQLDSLARRINNMPSFRGRVSVGGGGGLTLHEGGVVPGRRGEEVAAILQAGEHVTSLQDMDRLNRGMVAGLAGGGGGDSSVLEVRFTGNGALYEQVNRGVRNGDIQLEVDGKRVGVRR